MRAKQVSEANLRSEQGGIILPHSFSPSHMQKKKLKKIKISHMDGGQLKNVCLLSACLLSVCLLSVYCLSVVCFLWQIRPKISFALLVWLEIFFYKN
jgi:hypothetical protein